MLRWCLFAAIGMVLAGTGCSSSGPTQAAASTSPETDFNELAGVYKYISENRESPPRNLDDLRLRFSDPLLQVIPKIDNGEYVLAWNIPLATGSEGDVILAYEKSAPQSGGYVLLRNGNVKKMTAAEFTVARKAR